MKKESLFFTFVIILGMLFIIEKDLRKPVSPEKPKVIETSYDNGDSEISKKETAIKPGLPADAIWQDISDTNLEIVKIRKESAIKLGLPADASWKDIDEKNREVVRRKRQRN